MYVYATYLLRDICDIQRRVCVSMRRTYLETCTPCMSMTHTYQTMHAMHLFHKYRGVPIDRDVFRDTHDDVQRNSCRGRREKEKERIHLGMCRRVRSLWAYKGFLLATKTLFVYLSDAQMAFTINADGIHVLVCCLHTTYYILHTTYYILHTTYYILHTTYYIHTVPQSNLSQLQQHPQHPQNHYDDYDINVYYDVYYVNIQECTGKTTKFRKSTSRSCNHNRNTCISHSNTRNIHCHCNTHLTTSHRCRRTRSPQNRTNFLHSRTRSLQ